MQKAGGIISIIAGIFGLLAAGVTLVLGGLGSALDAEDAGTVVGLGWGGVVFSFLVIILGAIAISAETKKIGTLLIVSSVAGAILGGTLVALFMGLSLIGGILATVSTKAIGKKEDKVDDDLSHTNSSENLRQVSRSVARQEDEVAAFQAIAAVDPTPMALGSQSERDRHLDVASEKVTDAGREDSEAIGAARANDFQKKQCPFCAEDVLVNAIKCRHCKSDLLVPVEQKEPSESSVADGGGVLLLILALGGMFALFVGTIVYTLWE